MIQPASRLVETLKALKPGTHLPKFISHIRFPRFKNLSRGLEITFSFPVTALVGPNGSGKTSALHALYGAPLRKSTSDFWFTTDVDPIVEGAGEPNRFVYGHWLEGEPKPVETRKARVASAKDEAGRLKRRLGYFEPTKAVKKDGMDLSAFKGREKKKGKALDRWLPVDRDLLYLNFRSQLGAFDKFFFWGEHTPTKTLSDKNERIQLGARRLGNAIKNGRDDLELRGRRVVFENKLIDRNLLKIISWILDKQYTSARVVDHSYYGGSRGVSVQFESAGSKYSEAYAGSGELAVVALVDRVASAPDASLILLDEPEVSLHPAAQERLLCYLLNEALKRKHQIVFSTHSPSLIRELPPEAIKVFYDAPDGTFTATNQSHPYAAFNRIGVAPPNRTRVYVEDALACTIVKLALQNLSEDERSLFDVQVLPGGAKDILAHRVSTLMLDASRHLLLLDGDQAWPEPVPSVDDLPPSQDATLAARIRSLTGVERVKLGGSGGDDPNSEITLNALRRRYLTFLKDRIRFLPECCPEAIVLKTVGVTLPAELDSPTAKTMLQEHLESLRGPLSASEAVDTAGTLVALKKNDNPMLMQIVAALKENMPTIGSA